MNADDFAVQLEGLAPPLSALTGRGLSEPEAVEFRAGYVCRRLSRSAETDSLLDLCANFDVSSVEISVLTLCRPSDFDRQHWSVGHFEADIVVYPKAGGAVSTRDHEDLKRQLCSCARTSDAFLSALLVVARFATERILHPEQAEEPATGRHVLDQCLLFAGKECEPFYRVLLGVS
jgi:hypothetical protein